MNPVYLIITYFRQIVLMGSIPSLWFHGLMAAYALVALGIGCGIYKKYNNQFLYYV